MRRSWPSAIEPRQSYAIKVEWVFGVVNRSIWFQCLVQPRPQDVVAVDQRCRTGLSPRPPGSNRTKRTSVYESTSWSNNQHGSSIPSRALWSDWKLLRAGKRTPSVVPQGPRTTSFHLLRSAQLWQVSFLPHWQGWTFGLRPDLPRGWFHGRLLRDLWHRLPEEPLWVGVSDHSISRDTWWVQRQGDHHGAEGGQEDHPNHPEEVPRQLGWGQDSCGSHAEGPEVVSRRVERNEERLRVSSVAWWSDSTRCGSNSIFVAPRRRHWNCRPQTSARDTSLCQDNLRLWDHIPSYSLQPKLCAGDVRRLKLGERSQAFEPVRRRCDAVPSPGDREDHLQLHHRLEVWKIQQDMQEHTRSWGMLSRRRQWPQLLCQHGDNWAPLPEASFQGRDEDVSPAHNRCQESVWCSCGRELEPHREASNNEHSEHPAEHDAVTNPLATHNSYGGRWFDEARHPTAGFASQMVWCSNHPAPGRKAAEEEEQSAGLGD